ncbi:MAG: (d)CMP kinase, partial [Thermoanaerobaculia bacterium]
MTQAPLVVAIDGPSGVGKTTVAQEVARRLELPYLETGAMYRAIGLAALDRGVDLDDADTVEAIAANLDLAVEMGDDRRLRVLVDGVEPGPRLRSPEVSEATSRIAVHPCVRRRMVALQRDLASRWGGVVEGRDIGTRVFPETPHKFFLTAADEVRLDRRA